MSYKPKLLSIADGGTNARSFTQSNGIVTYNGTSLVNYAGPQLNSSGISTNSSQPAFYAYFSSVQTNITGNGTVVNPLIFDATAFNQGSNYNTSTGVFTAPIAGIYLFNCMIYFIGLLIAHTVMQPQLVCSTAGTFNLLQCNPGIVRDNNGNLQLLASLMVKLALNETVQQSTAVYNGTKVVGLGSGALGSSFGGYLLC